MRLIVHEEGPSASKTDKRCLSSVNSSIPEQRVVAAIIASGNLTLRNRRNSMAASSISFVKARRSEERRVGKEC